MELSEQKLCIFWTFNGNAQQAMEFYASVLPGAEIQSLILFEKGMPNGDEGKVLNGCLSYGGQEILFMDMQAKYPAPAFSWANSYLVNCITEAEFDLLFKSLSEGGTVMMGPEQVMDIRKCAWVIDKFGITWQFVWK